MPSGLSNDVAVVEAVTSDNSLQHLLPTAPPSPLPSQTPGVVKLEVDEEEERSRLCSNSLSSSRSHYPNPSSNPSRRLVTSGSKWCQPVPDECRAYNPFYKESRQAWLEKEMRWLKEERGLKILRAFYRDDGLTINWAVKDGEC